jgi:hypothetical protein
VLTDTAAAALLATVLPPAVLAGHTVNSWNLVKETVVEPSPSPANQQNVVVGCIVNQRCVAYYK